MEVIANSPQGETVIQTENPVYKPRTMQTVIAVFLSGAAIFYLFMRLASQPWFCYDDSQEENFHLVFLPMLVEFSIAIGLLFLGLLANNKATRVALIVGCISSLLSNVLPLYAQCWSEEYSYIALPFPDEIRPLIDFFPIVKFLVIYAYATVIINNNISTTNKSWIGILMLLMAKTIYDTLLCPTVLNEEMGTMWVHVNYYLVYNTAKCIDNVLMLLSIPAYWHLSRCEAFSGNYNASAKPNYSPFNRYMAMSIIVPAIMLLCVYLLYKNYELFT